MHLLLGDSFTSNPLLKTVQCGFLLMLFCHLWCLERSLFFVPFSLHPFPLPCCFSLEKSLCNGQFFLYSLLVTTPCYLPIPFLQSNQNFLFWAVTLFFFLFTFCCIKFLQAFFSWYGHLAPALSTDFSSITIILLISNCGMHLYPTIYPFLLSLDVFLFVRWSMVVS